MAALELRGPRLATQALPVWLAVAVFWPAGVAVSLAHAASVRDAPPAVAARTITLNERANLHLAKSNGVDKLYEQGQGYGTFNCPVQLNLTISSRQVSVAATFTAYPAGGSISGVSAAHYRIVGTTSYFTGILTVTRGTGRYAHASATALQLSGQMNRTSYEARLQVTGRLNV